MASSKGQECHICLEELRQELAACPCGHVFHHSCILQALHVNSQCPICRRRVRDADVVSLYFDAPVETLGPLECRDVKQEVAAGGGDSVVLSTRVNALMERVQWQNKQQERLVDELRRLRSQSEQLLADKQALAQRVGALEFGKTELVHKVAKYQMELSRQTEATRRLNVNQSIVRYLETCDAAALEDEIQNPRELIMALKKACKFRHDQYQKVVKDKMRLKAMLQNSQPQTGGSTRGGKAKMRGASHENKRAYPTSSAGGVAFAMGGATLQQEAKKRKTDSSSSALDAFIQQQSSPSTPIDFTPRSESAGFRANAYSDVSIRPATSSRPTFGRSSFNPNQYGAFNLAPASDPPMQLSGSPGVMCRRGYDETGKLTNFFLPKESAARSLPRQKTIPSMQNLLNAQPRAAGGSAQQQRTTNNDRREYALTNWLRNT
ncbi:hypothetical protein BBJ28_00010473 [Nothophytophthora sp. Chile5]|nr:hypothetical protein BBJ28_00010473 [Nothophytophthora sp. Chile5]